jgi:hypothetical protein
MGAFGNLAFVGLTMVLLSGMTGDKFLAISRTSLPAIVRRLG